MGIYESSSDVLYDYKLHRFYVSLDAVTTHAMFLKKRVSYTIGKGYFPIMSEPSTKKFPMVLVDRRSRSQELHRLCVSTN
ncbi:hypothetical protein C4D60_Mb05t17360 [Musa balbisiana]|uniref:Uncharacterized protein n=1 Tax=Musa balbisiana TaxID=52838 RepID=A0A4S8JWT4_MUSBA|nr:hypothetical protein C4D60_Mb05t17360 [Musa balbisiana]